MDTRNADNVVLRLGADPSVVCMNAVHGRDASDTIP
jgi:hypothetical protein